MADFDWVVRGARVVDGTGAPSFVADVGWSDGTVRTIGAIAGVGRREIIGEGCVLAPGFVDAHAHDDFVVFVDPHLRPKVLQGVTTTIVGNCGIGPAPRGGAQEWITRLHPGAQIPTYDGYVEYARRLTEAGPSIHYAVLAGHGSLRRAAAPHATARLSREERRRLFAAYDEALAAGVLGLSSGLIYEPGCFAPESEFVELLAFGRDLAPLYATHLRNESRGLLGAVDEALRIAEAAGVGLQLSHHKAHGRDAWGLVRDSLARVDAAAAAGLDVWLDVYPYIAGSTVLSAVARDLELGASSRIGRLDPGDLVVSSSARRPDLVGRSLAALMDESELDKVAMVRRLLEWDEGMWVILFAMAEEDVRQVLRHPRALVGSDGLPLETGQPHPRLWGAFARVLGHYSRDSGLFPLEDAIAKMTGRAAARFGLGDRGRVEVGFAADLVLLDPEKLAEGATFDDPTRPPVGVRSVWVDGTLTVKEGEHTGARAGKVLRRAPGPASQLSFE